MIESRRRGNTIAKVYPFQLLLPIVIVIAFFVLAFQRDLRLAVPLLIGASAVIVIALAGILYLGRLGRIFFSPTLILGVALLLRCLFVFAPPQLSDDIYRYLWDGSNLLHSVNPYAVAPAAITPPPELAALHARINHPDYITIYPPVAQVIFAGGAALGGTVTGLKIFLVLIDLGLCALLLLLLKRLEMSTWQGALYAWNPLPILEIAGSGHVDGAGLILLLGAFYLLLPERTNATVKSPRYWPFLLAGALLAGAGLVKLFPFVLTPVLFLLVPTSRRLHFIGAFLGVLAALLLPFLPQLINMAATLESYARHWEFAGFAFNTLRKLTGSGTTARLLLSSCFLLVVGGIVFRLSGKIQRGLSPLNRGRQALVACYAIAMALLLLSPTLQPWYALSLAVFLPFCAGPAGLVLCWAVLLTYQVQIPYFILGEWIENPQVTGAVFLAPVTACLFSSVFRGGRQTLG